MKKRGEGWQVIVNQISDEEICREESAVADDEGSVNSELSTSPVSLFHGSRNTDHAATEDIRSSSQSSHICYSGTSK